MSKTYVVLHTDRIGSSNTVTVSGIQRNISRYSSVFQIPVSGGDLGLIKVIRMYWCVRHTGKCVYVWVSQLKLSRYEISLLSSNSGSVVDLGEHLCVLETPDHHIQLRMTLLKVVL
jgi:hypothetical protein